MKVKINTFTESKDKVFHIELGTLKDMIKDKVYYPEFGNPDLSMFTDHKIKLERICTADMANVAGTLEDLSVEDDGTIIGYFSPSELFKNRYPKTEEMQPEFGIRALSNVRYDDNEKVIHDINQIITWDLIRVIPKIEIPKKELIVEDNGDKTFRIKLDTEFLDKINKIDNSSYKEIHAVYTTDFSPKEPTNSKVITTSTFDFMIEKGNKYLPLVKETFKEILEKENEILLFMTCNEPYEIEDVFVFYLKKET